MDSVSAVDADFEPNIKEGRVELTFNMNYFETTEGAESLEGLLDRRDTEDFPSVSSNLNLICSGNLG